MFQKKNTLTNMDSLHVFYYELNIQPYPHLNCELNQKFATHKTPHVLENRQQLQQHLYQFVQLHYTHRTTSKIDPLHSPHNKLSNVTMENCIPLVENNLSSRIRSIKYVGNYNKDVIEKLSLFARNVEKN